MALVVDLDDSGCQPRRSLRKEDSESGRSDDNLHRELVEQRPLAGSESVHGGIALGDLVIGCLDLHFAVRTYEILDFDDLVTGDPISSAIREFRRVVAEMLTDQVSPDEVPALLVDRDRGDLDRSGDLQRKELGCGRVQRGLRVEHRTGKTHRQDSGRTRLESLIDVRRLGGPVFA